MDIVLGLLDKIADDEMFLFNMSEKDLKSVIAEFTQAVINKQYSKSICQELYKILAVLVCVNTLPYEERWALYEWLERRAFVDLDYACFDYELREAYKFLFYELQQRVDETEPQILEKYMSLLAVPEGAVYIITDQFLSSGHAPTRDVLDYANVLCGTLDKNVVIINASFLNYKDVPYISGRTTFKYKETLDHYNRYIYKEIAYPFYQCDCKMPNVQEIANVLCFISFKNPSLVLSVGGPNPLADLCRKYCKTAAIPCHTYLPRSMANNLIICRSIREEDKKQIGTLEDGQNVIESVFTYGPPKEPSTRLYNPSEYNIDDDSFDIVIVGNRLILEIDKAFEDMCLGLIETLPKVKIHIIGDYNNPRGVNNDRFIMHGKQNNADQLIRYMNLLIQPNRVGGARAAYEALYYKIPVITTRMGDTWDVCGEEFAVNDYVEMDERIRLLYSNKNKYKEVCERAGVRSKVLSNVEGAFRGILSRLL